MPGIVCLVWFRVQNHQSTNCGRIHSENDMMNLLSRTAPRILHLLPHSLHLERGGLDSDAKQEILRVHLLHGFDQRAAGHDAPDQHAHDAQAAANPVKFVLSCRRFDIIIRIMIMNITFALLQCGQRASLMRSKHIFVPSLLVYQQTTSLILYEFRSIILCFVGACIVEQRESLCSFRAEKQIILLS